MEKSLFSQLGEVFRTTLVEMRLDSGLSVRQLAARLKREISFVYRIEHGQRRVDFVEFYWICRAMGRPARKAADAILRKFEASEKLKKP